MSKKAKKNDDLSEDSEELGFDKNDREIDDNDYDYQDDEHQQMQDNKRGENTQKVNNQHFDEAVELSDDGSEIKSQDENNKSVVHRAEPPQKQQPKTHGKPEGLLRKKQDEEEGSDDEDKKGSKLVGGYNPDEYANLNVTQEIQELFKYITRYKPQTMDLETKLKPFVPDYIPAVGEVDAFLKMPRVDNQPETLGLEVLDEPALNQSKRAILSKYFDQNRKKHKAGKSQQVHSIDNAEKNPKAILSWINDVSELQKKKQPPSVSYSKQMPDIDTLMQVWPMEMEEAFSNIQLPNEEIDLNLEDYCKMACSLLDIPIHNTQNSRNIIESLHVFFTLFSEFKANQHFQQQKVDEYDQTYPPNNSYN